MQAALNLQVPAYHQGSVRYLKIPMDAIGKSWTELTYTVDTKHTDVLSPIKAIKSIRSREGANQSGEKDDVSQVCQPASPSATIA